MIEVYFYKKKNYFFPILHESSPGGDRRFHEHKKEIKGIIGIRNFWTADVISGNNERKKSRKDQELIQSSTTPDLGYLMGKCQKTQLNITNKSQ